MTDPIVPFEIVEVPARTSVTVSDEHATIETHKRAEIILGTRGPQGPKGDTGERSKAGWVTYTSFLGSPRKAPVRFDIPFPDTNYGIVVGGKDTRQWSIEDQTPEGFTINSNADREIKFSVFWNATSKWG